MRKLIIANLLILLGIGIVIVRSNSKDQITYSQSDPQISAAALRMANDCSSQNQEKCYQESFKELIKKQNFQFAEQTLYALWDIDPMTKSCHVLSHFMARDALRKNPDQWLELLDGVNVNACGSGFLHGVLEGHLGDDPDTEFNGRLSEEICNRGDDNYRKRMCTHFMGHFFIVSTNDNVEAAVPLCDDVSDSLKFDCLNGLFMEHNQKIALVDHDLGQPPSYTAEYAKSLEEVCLKYSGVHASACWTEMAEVYAKTFGYDPKIIYEKCFKHESRNAQSCYGKGQTILATYPMELNPEQITAICEVYKEDVLLKACLGNTITSLMYYSVKFTPRGITLCENISRLNQWCFEQLGQVLSRFSPTESERVLLCQPTKEEKFRSLCARVN